MARAGEGSLPAAEIAAPLVELSSVTKVYGRGESEVHALAGISMRIDDGEFVAVMGASGSGKSTCLNMLGCLDVPTEGHYLFRGVDVGGLNANQLARLRRTYLGFVFQGFNLLPRTTAVENVELPLIYRGVGTAERRRRALRALGDVGLGDRASHTPAELSGGQQQRVAIARAIVTEPQLLLADEPTGNLDTARKVEIMNLLVTLNRERGITIAMVTHEQDMVRFVSRTVVFRDGVIASDSRAVAT